MCVHLCPITFNHVLPTSNEVLHLLYLYHMYFYTFVYIILYLHSFHFTPDHSTLTYLLSAIMEPSDGSMVPISCTMTYVYC